MALPTANDYEIHKNLTGQADPKALEDEKSQEYLERIGNTITPNNVSNDSVADTASRQTHGNGREYRSMLTSAQKMILSSDTAVQDALVKAFVDNNGNNVSYDYIKNNPFSGIRWMNEPLYGYYGVEETGQTAYYDYVKWDESVHVVRWVWVKLCSITVKHTIRNYQVVDVKQEVTGRNYSNIQFNISPQPDYPGEIDNWKIETKKIPLSNDYDYTTNFWVRIKTFENRETMPDDHKSSTEKQVQKANEPVNDPETNPDDNLLTADEMSTEWAEEYYSVYEDAYNSFDLQTFNYIIGLPCQFMEHVDTRWGDTAYGGDYVESILYDAPIATLIPGGPYLTTGDGKNDNALEKILGVMAKGYAKILDINEHGVKAFIENEFTTYLLDQKYRRFFTFSPDYTRYIEYVNTLCQLFIQYLGIQDRICPITNKPYSEYSDTIEETETDAGKSFTKRYGKYKAIHIYYSPQSNLTTSTSNSTRQSQIMETLNSFSSMAKEAAFLAGAAGISKRSGVTLGETEQSGGFFTSALGTGSNNALGTALSSVASSAETIFSGNNLQLPEIYSDSSNGGNSITLDFTLASPYGDEESIFLHELRPLARIMALSYPRQFGPNGYTSPFICQCFSKGQFNCVLGIVESLNISRGGNGGEATTGAGDNIPLELNVSLTIKDLYDQVVLSNMYELGDDMDQLESIIFTMNNVGLLNFTASFAGYNCNAPEYEQRWDFLTNAAYNKIADVISFKEVKDISSWKFPKFSRWWVEKYEAEREKHSTWTR